MAWTSSPTGPERKRSGPPARSARRCGRSPKGPPASSCGAAPAAEDGRRIALVVLSHDVGDSRAAGVSPWLEWIRSV
ncbi:hypothetical protein DZF92_12505, partial [Clavibacter michiganensis subsp. insidiosus]